jgi:hypothetical protein
VRLAHATGNESHSLAISFGMGAMSAVSMLRSWMSVKKRGKSTTGERMAGCGTSADMEAAASPCTGTPCATAASECSLSGIGRVIDLTPSTPCGQVLSNPLRALVRLRVSALAERTTPPTAFFESSLYAPAPLNERDSQLLVSQSVRAVWARDDAVGSMPEELSSAPPCCSDGSLKRMRVGLLPPEILPDCFRSADRSEEGNRREAEEPAGEVPCGLGEPTPAYEACIASGVTPSIINSPEVPGGGAWSSNSTEKRSRGFCSLLLARDVDG